MRWLGWVRSSVAVVSLAALGGAMLMDPEVLDTTETLAVIASPVEEYQSLIAALQQQAAQPILTSDSSQWQMQRQTLSQQQPDAWLVLANEPLAQAWASDETVTKPRYQPQIPLIDMPQISRLIEQQIAAQLGKDAALMLISGTSPATSDALLTHVEQDVGFANIQRVSADSPQLLAELAEQQGYDAILVTGNLATEATLRELKRLEKLQTTQIFAVGYCYHLLDAINAGTLDGLVYLPPEQLAQALLAETKPAEQANPVKPLWVDKQNVADVMQGV